MPATTIGKYRIVGTLGRGATGIVYRAADDSLGRDVALKVLNPAFTDAGVLKRFRAEATVLARLNHPGIATIYDLFEAEDALLMVMELVRGETLEQLSCRAGPLAPDRAAYLVDRILSALEHAHSAGVVHRDMKPANVMLAQRGRVKIMDFGVARALGADHNTADGYIVGTPAYMAPEQVLGQQVDQRADLYSVGVIFYRLVTGMLPFEADSPMGMLQQQISQEPAPLRLHRADLPGWCQAIVERALSKSPADRFQTADAFRETLARAAGMATWTNLATELLAAEAVSPSNVGTMRLRQKYRARDASILAAFAALVGALAFLPLLYGGTGGVSAAPAAIKTTPEVVFRGKVLAGSGPGRRERDARVVLSDRTLSITTTGERRSRLHSVPYDSVISISYSRGADPMWNSPKGPAHVARAPRGAVRTQARTAERHWIAVRAKLETPFVVLRFEDPDIKQVLSALEQRTGRAPEVVRKTKRSSGAP
jgi:Protein kinase domain